MENYKKRLNRNNQELAAEGRKGEHVAKLLKRYRESISRDKLPSDSERLLKKKVCSKQESGLSLEEFSIYLHSKGIEISESTLRNYEAGDRLPTTEHAVSLAKLMGVSLDEMLLGIPSKQVSAQTLTGLSNKAIKNLARIKNNHIIPGEQHLLPLLCTLLSDDAFLEVLNQKVGRLVYHRAREQADSIDSDCYDTDLSDGIEYAIAREFVNCIQSYVNNAVSIEANRMSREDLEYMWSQVHEGQQE